MIFVDTSVFLYAVGRAHPLREPARVFFRETLAERVPLVTSAEVVQELLYAYLPVGRLGTLDAALTLVDSRLAEVWTLDVEDVRLARRLANQHPGLSARDLVHLASSTRRGAERIVTFDRALAATSLGSAPPA